MTSRDVYFFGNACAFSSRKAVSVPTSVIGGLGAPWRSANLSITVRSGAEERTIVGARLDVPILKPCSYHVFKDVQCRR